MTSDGTDPLVDFARKVKLMRDLQREFFDKNRRKQDTLRRSLAAERSVDEAVREVLGDEQQTTLF